MPSPSDPALRVLLALRLASFAPVETVAARAGLPVDDAAARLDDLARDGAARFRDGRRSGWSLTGEGRKEGERLLGDELDALGARPAVEVAYQRFLAENPTMLRLCTDWQMLPGDDDAPVLNDHADADYDRQVVERLVELDERSRPIWLELDAVLERFGEYRERFDRAVGHVRDGDHDWFTKPSIDSYHTVWFELHENLLATLGIERSSEGAAVPGVGD
jgi:hypothetical protein